MKKVMAAVLSLALALSLAACGWQNQPSETPDNGANGSADEVVQIPNPFTEYGTYEEARDAAGYAFAAPETLDNYPDVTYSVMNAGELFQILYRNDEDEIVARKAPGEGDISGDYNEYTIELEIDKDNLPGVTLRGDGEKMYLAIWTDPERGYAYSLMVRGGMEQNAFAALVEQIQAAEAALGDGGMDAGPVTGGWAVNSGELSMSENPEAMAAFEKAVDGLTGYSYEPLALLGSQVVAGMNYRILCRSTVVVPDAVPTYEIITVYQDLEGNAEITNSAALPGFPEAGENISGGWTVNTADPALDANPEVADALEKALEGLVGAEYEAAAFLASQVVAGNNYLLFCRVTPVVPDPVPSFTVVKVYADLDGTAEITDVTDVAL